jgi:PHD/YefM family antitoxin component YafN of YafNO toxin-antitoxin module
MKTIHTDTENIRELLKDTEKQPIFIQGPNELAGVLLSVETYELLGRYDEGMLGGREDEEDETRSQRTTIL